MRLLCVRCFVEAARFAVAALCCAWVHAAGATDVQVDFGQPDPGNFLRLNMGSNGWTNGNLSQYYDDLAVQYRRMDHWNNFLGPIRRRPDGGLWYDYWTLDHAIYEGTGGFRNKPYATVDYSPACFTTEFLRNPLIFERPGFEAQLTPAGTIIVAGNNSFPSETAQTAMFELNRKGIVIWRGDYYQRFAVTPSNWLVINQDDGTYQVLDAAQENRRRPGAVPGASRR